MNGASISPSQSRRGPSPTRRAVKEVTVPVLALSLHVGDLRPSVDAVPTAGRGAYYAAIHEFVKRGAVLARAAFCEPWPLDRPATAPFWVPRHLAVAAPLGVLMFHPLIGMLPHLFLLVGFRSA